MTKKHFTFKEDNFFFLFLIFVLFSTYATLRRNYIGKRMDFVAFFFSHQHQKAIGPMGPILYWCKILSKHLYVAKRLYAITCTCPTGWATTFSAN